MKLIELFEESDYLKDMEHAIVDIVVSLRARQVDKIYIHQIIRELRRRSFFIDKEDLGEFLESLEDIEGVDVGSGEIYFVTDEASEVEEPEDDAPEVDDESEEDKERVQSMKAQKALDREKSKDRARAKELSL